MKGADTQRTFIRSPGWLSVSVQLLHNAPQDQHYNQAAVTLPRPSCHSLTTLRRTNTTTRPQSHCPGRLTTPSQHSLNGPTGPICTHLYPQPLYIKSLCSVAMSANNNPHHIPQVQDPQNTQLSPPQFHRMLSNQCLMSALYPSATCISMKHGLAQGSHRS
jgi:hypothetical protein